MVHVTPKILPEKNRFIVKFIKFLKFFKIKKISKKLLPFFRKTTQSKKEKLSNFDNANSKTRFFSKINNFDFPKTQIVNNPLFLDCLTQKSVLK